MLLNEMKAQINVIICYVEFKIHYQLISLLFLESHSNSEATSIKYLMRHAVWLRRLFENLKRIQETTYMLTTNLLLQLQGTHYFTEKCKTIDLQFHYIEEHVKKINVELVYIKIKIK